MPDDSLVVIGASAGGLEALTEVFRDLPPDFPGAVLVVVHVAASSPSLLPNILGRASRLPVHAASDGLEIETGHAYVAVPDRHLLVQDGHIRLEPSARVNGHRPAVDPLFCSAADARGGDVIGVILSGTRDDGTLGMARVHRAGGRCLVQDPEEARHDGMPRSAIENVPVDAVVRARDMGALLTAWAQDDAPPGTADPVLAAAGGKPLITVCPDCGGVLTEHAEGGAVYFECHVGHQYGPRTLADRQGVEVDAALWTAVRTLEDRKALLDRLATQAEARGHNASSRHFRRQAKVSTEQADAVREALAELGRASGLGDTLATIEEIEG